MFERIMCFFLGALGIMVLPDLLFMIHGGDFQQGQILYLLIFLLVNLALAWLARKFGGVQFGWLRGRDWLGFTIFLFLTISLLKMYGLLFPQLHSTSAEGFEAMVKSGLSLAFWLDILCLGPIMEELLMRGLLQKGAFQQQWWGIFLTASIFSLAHGPADVTTFGFYALMGSLFGLGYKLTDKIWVAIFLHMGWNIFVTLPILLFQWGVR